MVRPSITNPPAWALYRDYLDALERHLGFVPCIRYTVGVPVEIKNSRGNMDFNKHTTSCRRTFYDAPKSGEDRGHLKELIYDRYSHRWVEWDPDELKYVPYYREGQGRNRIRGTRQLLMIMIATKLSPKGYKPKPTELLLPSAEERSIYFVRLPPVGCFIHTATPAFFLSVVAAAAAAATPPPAAGALVGAGGAPPAAPGPVPGAAAAAAAAPPPVGPPPVGPPPVGPPAVRNA